ncbi:MAG TPA: pentapeptide repeat-containing protein [Actinomycetes bacterium]
MSARLKLVGSVVRQSWWLFVLAAAVVVLQRLGWDRAWQAAGGLREALVGAARVAWPLLLAAAVVAWRYRRASRRSSPLRPRPPTEAVTRSPWPVVLLAVAIVALFAACVFVVPGLLVPRLRVSPADVGQAKDRLQLENDRLKARNDARTALLQGLGGLVVVAGAYLTWRQVRATLESQAGERFAKAVEQLRGEDRAGRIAGVYFLDRVLKSSPTDRGSVVVVLTDLIRGELSWPPKPDGRRDRAGESLPVLRDRAPDAQAALTVLGGQPISAEIRVSLTDLDMRRASLVGAKFPGANFRGSCLDEASLRGRGDFTEGWFWRASLRRASFEASTIRDASFHQADLRGVVLNGLDVTGVDFTGALMERADLRGVQNLPAPGTEGAPTEEQLRLAIVEDDRWEQRYPPATRDTAARLVEAALRLANLRTAARDAAAELRQLGGGDRAAVELAVADCLVVDTDWLLRLDAAALLDPLEQPARGRNEAEGCLPGAGQWWRR